MRDEKRVVDPRYELGADVVNLAFWQAAGISKVVPLLAFTLESGNTSMVMTAWDTAQYAYQAVGDADTFALASSPWVQSIATLGDGRVTVQFVDTVPDMAGNTVDLNFMLASCQVTGTARGSAVVSVGSGGRQNLLTLGAQTAVGTFDAAADMLVTVW